MGQELEVIHTPNPCGQHESDAFPHDPFPFMWYYRTEVHNRTARPLRVVWFEAYRRRWFKWVPGNITGRELGNDDFRKWYGDRENLTEDGAVPAGEAAVCSVNWHGAHWPWSPRVKWAFRAVDDAGRHSYAEAEIRSKVVLNRRSIPWFIVALVLACGALVRLISRK